MAQSNNNLQSVLYNIYGLTVCVWFTLQDQFLIMSTSTMWNIVLMTASILILKCEGKSSMYHFNREDHQTFNIQIEGMILEECLQCCQERSGCTTVGIKMNQGSSNCYTNNVMETGSLQLTAGPNVETWTKGLLNNLFLIHFLNFCWTKVHFVGPLIAPMLCLELPCLVQEYSRSASHTCSMWRADSVHVMELLSDCI